MLWFIGGMLVLAIVVFFYTWLINSVKKEVQLAPRIPMYLCDKHGTFPMKYAIKISVPQERQSDLEVDMCIFCYDEKMKNAEKILKL